MSLFHIWNPFIHSDNGRKLSFILTRGDAYGLNRGTKDFVSQLANDMGLAANIEYWEINAYRSKYYTDFLGESDWRDNWQLIWRITLFASDSFVALPQMKIPWIETNVLDQTWEIALDDDEATVGCLVVVDFSQERDSVIMQDTILLDEAVNRFQKRYAVGKPIFLPLKVLGNINQVQIDLGQFPGGFFRKGADYAVYIIETCLKNNGTVHFSECL
ncbi:MAG: hypothetical protein DU489_01820 [Nitrosomonas sp.]|uniref:hypothetical protein n=1 Tax=Nitrosomonas sp. TaxID=42353 RepID=UPI0032F01244